MTDAATTLLRPPGATSEDALVAACIKCARCVEVCPYQAISLAPWSALGAYGTPIINPDRTPCYLCMRCPDVCPTSALEPLSAEAVQMGLARVLEANCLSYNYTVCNVCFQQCPLQGVAIDLDGLLRPVIDDAGCVGCGVCRYVCPADPNAIALVPWE